MQEIEKIVKEFEDARVSLEDTIASDQPSRAVAKEFTVVVQRAKVSVGKNLTAWPEELKAAYNHLVRAYNAYNTKFLEPKASLSSSKGAPSTAGAGLAETSKGAGDLQLQSPPMPIEHSPVANKKGNLGAKQPEGTPNPSDQQDGKPKSDPTNMDRKSGDSAATDASGDKQESLDKSKHPPGIETKPTDGGAVGGASGLGSAHATSVENSSLGQQITARGDAVSMGVVGEDEFLLASEAAEELQLALASYFADAGVAEYLRLKTCARGAESRRRALHDLENSQHWSKRDKYKIETLLDSLNSTLDVVNESLATVSLNCPKELNKWTDERSERGSLRSGQSVSRHSIHSDHQFGYPAGRHKSSPPLRNLAERDLAPETKAARRSSPPPTMGDRYITKPGRRTEVRDFDVKVYLPGEDQSINELTRAQWFGKEALSDLPTFSGNPLEYPPWRELVVSLLNCDYRGTLVTFKTLKKCLKGEALAKVDCVSPSTQNPIKEIFDILDQHYDHPTAILQMLTEKIEEVKKPDPDDPDQLYDFTKAVRYTLQAYERMGSEVRKEPWFFNKVYAKLHRSITRPFAERFPDTDHGNIDDLLDFVERRTITLRKLPDYMEKLKKKSKPDSGKQHGAIAAASLAAKPSGESGKKQDNRGRGKKKVEYDLSNLKRRRPKKGVCALCDSTEHEMVTCPDFLKKSPLERLYWAWYWFYCFHCLKIHRSDNCPQQASYECGENGCKRKHHVLLHGAGDLEDAKAKYLPKECKQTRGSKGKEPARAMLTRAPMNDDETAQATRHLRMIRVLVRAGPGARIYPAIALIDHGCNRTLIEEGFARKLGLRVELDSVKLTGVHGSCQELMASVGFEVSGKDGRFYPIPNALTKRGLAMNGPEIRWKDWASVTPPFEKIAAELDDTAYQDVKIYLGVDVEQLTLPAEGSTWLTTEDHGFIAYNTKLGWTITGPSVKETTHTLAAFLEKPEVEDPIEAGLLKAFYQFNELEALGIVHKVDQFSVTERREYNRMENGIRKLPDGRWEVPMLTKKFTRLPGSEFQARSRLESLYRRLDRDDRLKKLYHEGIRNDEALGYIRKLTPEEARELRGGTHWFLPHFPVFHPDKPDKCRRVLDAAAKNNGVSLNSFLETGPNILQSLFGILLRFRLGKVAVNADVNAMFSQVAIPKEQQNLVAFLWNEDPRKEPDVYVNERHIFGAACSPSVAIFALVQSAREEPQLMEILEASFYMDDFYWSANSEDAVLQTSKNVERLLASSGFILSKWMANQEGVIKSWPLDQRAKELKPLGSDLSGQLPVVKALGVAWDCEKDTFTFESRKLDKEVTTVASVLSVLASIFDPLGIVAPYTLTGKQMFQELWMALRDWKAVVPVEFEKEWKAWTKDLSAIASLSVPRWYGLEYEQEMTLHVFSDASKKGLGAVTYLKQGDVRPMFIAAKTRVVPPARQGNIPRLELQAALVAMRLAKMVLKELPKANVNRMVFWSDSHTVLRWITNEDVRYDQFIANRVAEVQEIAQGLGISVSWRYVPTDSNPADLASRGIKQGAASFGNHFDFWIHGPDFLNGPESQWPEELKEKKNSSKALLQQLEDFALVSLFEGEDYLIEGNDLVECLKKNSGKENPTAEELDNVEIEIIKDLQFKAYPKEIQGCKRSPTRTVIRRKGDLQRHQLWLDPKGVLRLQTRLFAAEDWPSDGALPIVLPKGDPFTLLVIRDAHRQVEHQGSNCTWAKVRERFFVPWGKTVIRRLCQDCDYCLVRRHKRMNPPLAGLHASRLQVNKPAWTETGMDHFGPFEIKPKQKRWGLIFICLTTRAVHLEDVDGLGVEPFCHALDRFICRRRRPEILRSDQGTTFVALSKIQEKTAEAYSEELKQAALARFRIDLRFNPAGAPHWGGSWERMIREVKKILGSTLTSVGKWRRDDFRTFLVRAEGILNRRPIAFGDNGEIVSPLSILQPDAEVCIGPPLGAPNIKSVEMVKKAETLFWQKWVRYYLPSISAQQVLGEVRNDLLLPGDKVLVREGSNPIVDSWIPGVIREVYPSSDGVIRSVIVKTDQGELYRDIRRISIIDGPVLRRRKGLPPPLGGVSALDTGTSAEKRRSPRRRI